jgi:sialic acid synthase
MTSRVITIGDKQIGGDNPCFFIAEAGINHQGELKYAKQLIDLAAQCECDCVKFQKRNVDRILTKEGMEKPYDNPNSFGATYGEHKRALELSEEDFIELHQYANDAGILFTASGWDEESVDFLDSIGVPFFKMASADLTNFPLLEHTARKGKPIIVSTGMADMETVRAAIALIYEINKDVILLQCTSTYPASVELLNLNVIKTYISEFPDLVIGYSGHENGIALSLCAVVMGARVIERHFTLDRTWKGGDHAASLEKPGLERLVRDIKNYERALGSFEKKKLPEEEAVFQKLAKSLVTAVPIQAGVEITRDMLTTKGPGTGISPMRLNDLIGKTLNQDLLEDVVIHDSYVNW